MTMLYLGSQIMCKEENTVRLLNERFVNVSNIIFFTHLPYNPNRQIAKQQQVPGKCCPTDTKYQKVAEGA